MGDCRMIILIQKDLLQQIETFNEEASSKGSNDTSKKQEESHWHRISKLFSSDTTVREVCGDSDKRLLALLEKDVISLWDCTKNPPKDITDWPIKEFPDLKGPRSKTLFDAGWFPSGTLQAVPKGAGPTRSTSTLQYDDAQYNLQHHPNASSVGSKHSDDLNRVKLANNYLTDDRSSSLPKPSQVFQTVASRFDSDDYMSTKPNDDPSKALQDRQRQQQERQQRQAAKFKKMEGRIRQLEEASSSNKNASVNAQVRKMLIKSRATGSKTLKMQDRVYFHIFLDFGDSPDAKNQIAKEHFCYFSIQDTVGRILSSYSPSTGDDAQAELLPRWTPAAETPVYCRLPVTMRIYEAMEKHFLLDVNKVVIRWFHPSLGEEPTPSILETVHKEPADSKEMVDNTQDMATEEKMDDSNLSKSEDHGVEYDEIASVLRQFDEQDGKKGKKKKSSTSDKVRQMLIKSKADGDKKRLKMEDRFFLEVIIASDRSVSHQKFLFHGKKDKLGRLLRDGGSMQNCQILRVTKNSTDETTPNFSPITDLDLSFQDAEARAILKPFDRLVLRVPNSS